MDACILGRQIRFHNLECHTRFRLGQPLEVCTVNTADDGDAHDVRSLVTFHRTAHLARHPSLVKCRGVLCRLPTRVSPILGQRQLEHTLAGVLGPAGISVVSPQARCVGPDFGIN